MDAENKIVILKFGGTSLSTRERWRGISKIVQEKISSGYKPVLVCSALSQVSNLLEELIQEAEIGADFSSKFEHFLEEHHALSADSSAINSYCAQLKRWLQGIQLLGECSPKTRAQILSLGELCSTTIGSLLLGQFDIPTKWLDARDLILSEARGSNSIEKHYLNSQAKSLKDPELIYQISNEPHKAYITQGFIGRDKQGHTVLFGRGGSDTSAAYLSAILDAKQCEIWTDVPGMFTANPKLIPSARLLKHISYKEAQEIATSGAKVLHPRTIAPLKKSGIPLVIRDTSHPNLPGTLVEDQKHHLEPGVKAIAINRPTQIVAVETMEMWNEVGFLAEFFAIFSGHGFSVNLISTSETNITVTVDREPGDSRRFAILTESLSKYGCVKTKDQCASISLIGRDIRSILPKIASSLNIFEDYPIHLLTQAANDLSLTYVVNDEHAEKIALKLHDLLFAGSLSSNTFGLTLTELYSQDISFRKELTSDVPKHWWKEKQNELLSIAAQTSPVYVYNLHVVQERMDDLGRVSAIDSFFYAMKANPKPEILDVAYSAGLGFECVSQQEIQHVLYQFPTMDPARILFTPNFAPMDEYAYAFKVGCHVTLDNLHPLSIAPGIFKNRNLILRMDPGKGQGHHRHVITAGKQSKFGIVPEEMDDAIHRIHHLGSKIVGLHAHAGSGIDDPEHWKSMGLFLSGIMERLGGNIQYINLGGGLGVPYKPEDTPLDLRSLETSLDALKKTLPNVKLWMEPGRFIAAECGVLLAKVTQLKTKGDIQYVGVEAGMNSIMRPSLYGAYHHIENLSRLDASKDTVANVVGPICETGDTLGFSRSLPQTEVGDVILIEKTGAYGHVMASNYNLRPPAEEIILHEDTHVVDRSH